jgi:hypothetical protein
MAGSVGYSATGSSLQGEPRLPQTISILESSAVRSTGLAAAAGDVGEQAAGDQRDALVGDVAEPSPWRRSRSRSSTDDLGTGGLDAQPGEDRDARPVRQATGYPLDGVGEDVALDSNLH